MIRFELSNGHKKALLIRAQPLRIALPAPATAPDNWLLWAREAIWEHGRLITGVIQDHIDVCPPSGQGLAGVIGRIVRQDETPVITWGVDVIICNVDPPVKARHPREVVQWPGRALNVETGQEWPELKQNTLLHNEYVVSTPAQRTVLENGIELRVNEVRVKGVVVDDPL